VKPQTKIGLAMVAAGTAIWAFTPSHVTWGNHHYIKHALAGFLLGIGALFLLVGSRS
jgi:uncharacterized membrane protein YidH (DUF202 family)